MSGIVNTDKSVAAPTIEPSATVSVNGTVKEKKNDFEWNVGRLYSATQEGHSSARTWAVRILSTLLVFPVVLTAIVDIGRRLAYEADLIDGKSWSLIDKTSQAASSATTKVSELFFGKDTIEKQNNRSEKAMKSLVGKIVDGYRSQNKTLGSRNDSFSGPAYDKIHNGGESLAAEVNSYIARNASKAEDFVALKTVLLGKIQQFFKEAAGKEHYVLTKTRHETNPILISDLAFVKFVDSLDTSGHSGKVIDTANREFANTRHDSGSVSGEQISAVSSSPETATGTSTAAPTASRVTTPEEHIQKLKKAVNGGVATKEQVAADFEQSIPQAVADALNNEGLARSTEVQKGLLDEAVKQKLLTPEQAQRISQGICPDVNQLAEGAAKDIVAINPVSVEGTGVIDDQEIVKVADKLKEQGKLNADNIGAFKAQVTKRVPEIRAEKAQRAAAHAAVVAQKQKEAEARILEARKTADAAALKEKQDNEAVAATLKAAQAEAAQKQGNLFGHFQRYLEIIQRKQGEIQPLLTESDALIAERDELVAWREKTSAEEIVIKPPGKSPETVKIIKAAERLNAAFDKIVKDKSKSFESIDKLIHTLAANEGIDQATIDIIGQLNKSKERLTAVINKLSQISVQAKDQQKDIAKWVDHYNVFKTGKMKLLNETNRGIIKSLEKTVMERQKVLDKELFEKLKHARPEDHASRDPSINLAVTYELFAQDDTAQAAKKSAAEAEKAKAAATQQQTAATQQQPAPTEELDSLNTEQAVPSFASRQMQNAEWVGGKVVDGVKWAAWNAPFHPLRGPLQGIHRAVGSPLSKKPETAPATQAAV